MVIYLQIVSRLGSELHRADESFVTALSMMAPAFELPLSDVTVFDGDLAVLECRVVAMPTAEVTWYLDGVEIRSSEEFRITSTEDGWHRLTITDTMLDDEGEYTVRAVNEAGSCISKAYLTVQRKFTDSLIECVLTSRWKTNCHHVFTVL